MRINSFMNLEYLKPTVWTRITAYPLLSTRRKNWLHYAGGYWIMTQIEHQIQNKQQAMQT